MVLTSLNDALTIFTEYRNLENGNELYLCYYLLTKSLETKFLRDLLSLNQEFQELSEIENPLFSDLVTILCQLSQVTDLIVRSEKIEPSKRLPFYAQMVEVLDKIDADLEKVNVLDIEKEALVHIIPSWKVLLLERIKGLKGQARIDIKIDLAERIDARIYIYTIIKNDGTGIAENIRVCAIYKEGQTSLKVNPESQIIDNLAPEQYTRLIYTVPAVEFFTTDQKVTFEVLYDDLGGKNRSSGIYTDIASLNNEEQEFKKLDPIPYVIGRPLTPSDLFIGREDIFKYVFENIETPSQHNIILIYGERRTGKTSILYQLEKKLFETGKYLPVILDFQGMTDPGDDAFLFDIATTIHDMLEEKNIKIPKVALSDFEKSPSAYFRNVFIKNTLQQLEGKKLALLVDEFEYLDERVKEGKSDRDIFGLLRHVMSHGNIRFIFAGTYDIAKFAKDYWSKLFNITLLKRVEFLNFQETKELVTIPVKDYFTFDDLALAKIWEVTAGHPFFVQLISRELINKANNEKTRFITIQSVKDIIQEVLKAGNIILGYIWDSISLEQKQLLSIISYLLSTRGVAIPEDIAALVNRYKLLLSLDESIRELLARGIIIESEKGYRFKMGLVGDWISTSITIENLLGSHL